MNRSSWGVSLALVAASFALAVFPQSAADATNSYVLNLTYSVNGQLYAGLNMPVGGYPAYQSILLTTIPAPGYVFSAWTGPNGAEVTDRPTPVPGQGMIYMDGEKTVGALFVPDTTPPTGTIVINGNHTATNTTSATLSLTWGDGAGGSGVVRMRFSNDGSTWSAWEPLLATRAYTLPAGDGYKTVRVQYLDRNNNRSLVYSDYIRLDTVTPTGGISINAGAATTKSQKVTLNLNWSDVGSGVVRMRFSDNGSNWTGWESQKATRAYTLPAGAGNHTVRVQYLDAAENYSPVYNDYIKLLEPAVGTTDTVVLAGNVPLVMVWMPTGSFTMGSPDAEAGHYIDEVPMHTVTLPGFWMAKFQLTKRQWMAVMGTTPWDMQPNVLADLDSPAVCVSWDEAQAFVTAINAYTGRTFHLPSESQWEYACRAGTTTRFYWGEDPDCTLINNNAWWEENGWLAGSHYALVVGQKLPNAWDLYDMLGNIWQWCADDTHDTYSGAPTAGQAWVDSPRGAQRVLRGGCITTYCAGCRAAFRYEGDPSLKFYGAGFRLAR